MKTYTEKLQDIWEEMRIVLQQKVAEKGIQSEVGFKTIELVDYTSDAELGSHGGVLTEIGKNLIFDNEGYSYAYGVLDYEQLAEITDYINTL